MTAKQLNCLKDSYILYEGSTGQLATHVSNCVATERVWASKRRMLDGAFDTLGLADGCCDGCIEGWPNWLDHNKNVIRLRLYSSHRYWLIFAYAKCKIKYVTNDNEQ
jgi:hypothetical protein